MDSDSDSSFDGFRPEDLEPSLPRGTLSDDSDLDVSEVSSEESDEEGEIPPLLTELPPPQWTSDQTKFVQADIQYFDEDSSGPTLPAYIHTSSSTPCDYFRMFLDKEVFRDIARHTNNYAKFKQEMKRTVSPSYVDKHWQETNGDEIQAFIALNIVMGLSPSRRIRHYWSKNKFLRNEGVASVMTCQRFEKLSEYFHVSDRRGEAPRGSANFDCWYKVRPILERLQVLFPMMMRPCKNQSIDEGLQPFKGRDRKIQYCPDKPRKRGFKFWIRCDADTGYVQQFQCYAGNKECNVAPASRNGMIFDVVDKLTRPLHNKRHHVFFDNLYTSVPTLQFLLSKGIYACGTLRMNKRHIPPAVKNFKEKGTRGEFVIFQDENNPNLTITAWRDTKVVRFAATNAQANLTCKTQCRTGRHYIEIYQPHAASLYGQFMGGVDNFDHLRERYRSGRQGKKAWKYLFWFLIDCALVNSYILYRKTSQRIQGNKNFDQFAFRMELVPSLIGGFSRREIVPAMKQYAFGPDDKAREHANVRLEGKGKQCAHHRKKFPTTPRHSTVYGCILCGAHLCKTCHHDFHFG